MTTEHHDPAPGILAAARSALGGELPERYDAPLETTFSHLLRGELRPATAILDVGSGRRPTIAPSDRPADSTYVGLDVSPDELEAAGPGAYDEWIVSDMCVFRPELVDRFDVVVSYQVFEHIKPLSVAVENLRRYLKPGGVMVAQLSGRYSVFGIANRALPHKVSVEVLARLLDRDRATVFPAFYDACSYHGLSRILADWSSSEIVPLFLGSAYFRFSKAATAAYLTYEELTERLRARGLASYYVIHARR